MSSGHTEDIDEKLSGGSWLEFPAILDFQKHVFVCGKLFDMFSPLEKQMAWNDRFGRFSRHFDFKKAHGIVKFNGNSSIDFKKAHLQ
jgi:hypothetical protein